MRDVDSQITRMRGERTKGDLIYAWTREISHARCLTFANCASNDTIVGEYFIVSSYFWTFNIALSSIPSWTVNVYDVCGSNQITKRDDHNKTDSNLYFIYLWGREISIEFTFVFTLPISCQYIFDWDYWYILYPNLTIDCGHCDLR